MHRFVWQQSYTMASDSNENTHLWFMGKKSLIIGINASDCEKPVIQKAFIAANDLRLSWFFVTDGR